MEGYEIATGALMGLGLAAACGLRIFLPLLVLSAANMAGWLPLTDGFAWLGTWPALLAFAVATVLEVGAYYVPWLDNLLDAVAAPAAVMAGALAMAASLTELDPMVQWSVSIIAGGGVAGAVHGMGGVLRGTSSVTTAGLANPVLSTLENLGSLLLSLLAMLLPIVAAVLALVLLLLAGRVLWRLLRRRRRRGPTTLEQESSTAGLPPR